MRQYGKPHDGWERSVRQTPALRTDTAPIQWDAGALLKPLQKESMSMQLSTLTPSRNIAARMGRWSASHRKIAIFGWLAFVIASIAIGTMVGQRTLDRQHNVGEAGRADRILQQAGFVQSGRLTEMVV